MTEPAMNDRSPRLVIADDNAEMRGLIRSAVESGFSEITELSDGRELLWELLHSSFVSVDPPRLVVITDVCMPAYDGLDVLDAWQEFERPVPTIVITSFPSDETRARVESLGATLLCKPFSRADLRGAVDRVCRTAADHDRAPHAFGARTADGV